MKNKNLTQKALPTGLLILALAMLFNPNVNVFDILPDFIGYFIIAALIKDVAMRVPFFEEARSGLIKLGFLSLARIPAFIFMISVRSVNTSDNDIIALLSFVFAIAEIILAVGTVNNLFAGLSYLGQRTGAPSVIGEKPSSDELRTFTLFFTVLKCALYSLPELLILTTTVDAGSPSTVGQSARFYPVVLLGGQIVGYAIGAAWLAFCVRYIRRLRHSGEFYPSVMQLSDPEKEAAIARKLRKSRILTGLKILPFAAFFSFNFTLEQLKGVNILPHFMIGFLLLSVIARLTVNKSKLYRASYASGAVYTVFSVVRWFFIVDYRDSYSYVEIALYDEASKAFSVIAVLSVIELILFSVFLAIFTVNFCLFIRTHTGKTPPGVSDMLSVGLSDTDYYASDRKYHKSLMLKAWLFFSIGIVGAAERLAEVFFSNNRVFAYGALIPEHAPWMNAVIFATSAIWGLYTLHLTNILAEDFEIKYSEAKINHEPHESQYF